jgi:NADH-quinone oxidoreductase subunit N
MALSLFSLAGIPPTAGFFGKMFLLTAGASKGNYLLIGFAAINMVISLYYYLRVVKTIFIDSSENPLPKLSGSFSLNLGLLLCFIGIVITGFFSGLYQYVSNTFHM